MVSRLARHPLVTNTIVNDSVLVMSTHRRARDGSGDGGPRSVRATIRYRLLVNALADPAEVAPRLPEGLRPHVTGEGTVIGHCLVDLDQVRPAPVPRRAGIRLLAAAHRLAVEWDMPGGDTVVGVYVTTRHTNSALGCALGGRWFPGVHQRAALRVDRVDDHVAWTVDPEGSTDPSIHVEAELRRQRADPAGDRVAAACLLPTLGVSPGHRGSPEAVRMQAEHQRGELVEVRQLRSDFIDSFGSARPAASFVVRDVEVLWSARPLPARVRPRGGEIVRL